ncbi:bacillithiol biosynthesis deacetylase BshB1 [Fulvivirga lutea]|uniref:Bacillithiol biosynthesis deacetylase BshB1 n=1 Tax=Fulvivirga lutea TaxID=2810512 RepID=A0A974WE35_9BACT|nr:bacillithiol biosynthesis deacetylase BshB1 [Fulvivirga lutea]QSE96584.1 bacillithiol biosynthesis deacetylase BshB1 [Fulvivirga lutea]
MKLNILAFAAHPDDTELSCAGTLATHVRKGYKVGVVDLTAGELGTRGTDEIRAKEAAESAKVLGLSVRDNLNLADGFFQNDKDSQLELIKVLRKYQPDIVLINAPSDRHPDHGRAAQLELDSCFLAGLVKVETELDGEKQTPWRPKSVYHYIQSNNMIPDFVVDVTDSWDTKMQAIKCFKTQFYDPESKEPETFISSLDFMKMIEGRAKDLGYSIGVSYGEGFIKVKNLGVSDLHNLL